MTINYFLFSYTHIHMTTTITTKLFCEIEYVYSDPYIFAIYVKDEIILHTEVIFNTDSEWENKEYNEFYINNIKLKGKEVNDSQDFDSEYLNWKLYFKYIDQKNYFENWKIVL